MSLFKDLLPKDHGREFAFKGKKSAGKPKGAGIIFILIFIFSSIIFVLVSLENIIYYILIFASMISGFLDDRSSKPWGKYKKGIIDLIISFLAAFAFVNFEQSDFMLHIGNFSCFIPKSLFIIIVTIVLWILINATNCSDGIDGFCGTLSFISMVSIGLCGFFLDIQHDILCLIIIMDSSILSYLWFNSEPSKLMMGDAGSRAIGLFWGIISFKTGNIFLFIPFCFVLICDGFLGIIKIFLLRFLKIRIFKYIKTPLHDYFRKGKSWSNA